MEKKAVEVMDAAESLAFSTRIAGVMRACIEQIAAAEKTHPLSVAVCILESIIQDLHAVDADLATEYCVALVDRYAEHNPEAFKQKYGRVAEAFTRFGEKYLELERAAGLTNPAPEVADVSLHRPEALSPEPAFRDRPDGQKLDVLEWCQRLDRDVTAKLCENGVAACFHLVAFYDENGTPLVSCLAAGRPETENGKIEHIVRVAANAASAYVSIGNPQRGAPDKSRVN